MVIFKNKTLRFYLLIVCLGVFISSCSFYKYRVQNKDKFTKKIDNKGKYSPKYFHYVVHHEDKILELQKVTINKKTQLITGYLAEFEGLPKQYYDKIYPDGLKTKKGKAVDFYAVQQVHIYLKGKLSANASGELEIPFSEIQRIELSKNAGAASFFTNFGITVLSIGVAVGVFLLIVCNCPHVYAYNGQEEVFNTTLFTGAKSAQLERHDYKLFPDYFSDSSTINIRIANDENENQFTNQLELLAVYHDKEIMVLPDKTGVLHSIKQPFTATKAFTNNSSSVIDKLSAIDNRAYSFDTDSIKPLSELCLTFANPGQKTWGKLVLRVKNSKWSGLVYDNYISQFGHHYKKWEKNNRKQPGEEKIKWMNEQGMNLLIDVKTAEGWKNLDFVHLVGDVSFNTVVVPVPLTEKGKNLELRLRSGFMFWELDYAAMDFTEDLTFNVQRLKPSLAKGNTGLSYVSELAEDDDSYMEHSSGNVSTEIQFEPIQMERAKTRTLILHSKGYYTDNKNYSGTIHLRKLLRYSAPGGLSTLSKSLFSMYKEQFAVVE